MLICLPTFLCSWNFRVKQAIVSPVELTFDFFTEQGSVTYGTIEYRVCKHGPLSGHWTLEPDGRAVADALKPNAFLRAFEVTVGNRSFTVKARSAFGRSFNIWEGEAIIGSIRPAHLFTRRATIDCSAEVPEPVQIFCFWLVVLTWKRAAQNHYGGANS